ncbi:MAG: hypothetical protein Q7T33_06230 [Dehalococcoidia bacterium]|nr:hypothetical protein [Dehalococcoidia bacterium]
MLLGDSWARGVGQLRFSRGIPLALTLAFILLLSYRAWQPLTSGGYFQMHDDAPAAFLFEMDKCFQDGQIPCRWAQDLASGSGAPLFNLQAPLAYYVGELIHLSGVSILDSVKVTFVLGFLLAGYLMFLLAREFWGNLGGMVSAAFYLYAPYQALDVYVGGKLAEQWAIAFVPGVLWGIYKVVREGKFHHALLLSLFLSLLLLSHNVIVLIFVPVGLIWATTLLSQGGARQRVPLLLLSGLWGLGLAAFFILPVIFEMGLTKAEAVTTGYFDYHRHFVDFNQLFISRFWGFGLSEPGPDDGLSFQIGWLHWGMAGIAVLVAPLLWRKSRVAFWATLAILALFWLSIFMMTERSVFIWEAIPQLKWLQFPWRLLALAIFACSFLAGSLFALLKNRGVLPVALSLALIAGVILLNQEFFKALTYVTTDEEKFAAANFPHLFDRYHSYVPTASQVYPVAAPAKVQVLKGTAVVSGISQGSDSLTFAMTSQGEATVRAAVIDYPNWRVRVDDRTVSHDHANEQGLITFRVPRGSHEISVKLENTPIRTVANYLSIAAWAAFVFSWLLWMTGGRWRGLLPGPGRRLLGWPTVKRQ